MPATLVDERARVWRVTAGVFPSNCYIVGLGSGRGDGQRCAVIDPGLDGAAIEQAIESLGMKPAAVLCTHGHFDHAGSASVLQRRHGCPVYVPEADVPTLRSSNFLLMAFKIDARIEQPEVTAVSAEHATVDVEGQTFSFHPVPGHTPGSCVVQHGDSLFTGDTLYARGVGLSKLPGEKPAQLRQSIQSLWERFAPHMQVHPGHGESAALGWIRTHNAALQAFLQADEQPTHST